MDNPDLVCFDFETSGTSPEKHCVLSIGAVAYDSLTLTPYDPSCGGEFYEEMAPAPWAEINPVAMQVNGLNLEALKKCPDQKTVFKRFVDWVRKFNPKKTIFTAPIAMGKRIRKFDFLFLDRLVKDHYPKPPAIFNTNGEIELEDLLQYWYPRHNRPFNSYQMDDIRPYFGLTTNKHHHALRDAREEGAIIIKFLQLAREIMKAKTPEGKPLVNLAGSCKVVA